MTVVWQNEGTAQAPFPWFGGKSRAAAAIWQRLGPDVQGYVEPFFGSGAVLLGRPGGAGRTETVNDKDGYIANFWRAVTHEPERVAVLCDWPANENDLHARHAWLVSRMDDDFVARLEGDPTFYDAQVAGWWLWGICCWIGGEFCSGKGPWQVVDGKLLHLGDERGVHRQRLQLGDGRGVHRQRLQLGDERGVHAWMVALAARLRRVRVCCGDWRRVLTPAARGSHHNDVVAVVLDPPYDFARRSGVLYSHDSTTISAQVREWAIEHGDDPGLRIALCGLDGEHEMPATWSVFRWSAQGGMGNQNGEHEARHDERVWFSPHCLPLQERQMALFAA